MTFDDSTAEDVFATFSVNGQYVLRLTADDGENTVSQTVTINASSTPNAAPDVDAGDDLSIQLPNNSVNLNGTVTDDGIPTGTVTTEWTVVSAPAGGGVTFGDLSVVDTTAVFSLEGDYVLRLTADDGDASSSDEMTVTVRSQFDPIAFNPTDDAYLENTTKFNDQYLKVEDDTRIRTSYLKFNVTGLAGANVTSATLRLHVNGDAGSGPVTVHLGSHNNWTEANLNNVNKPAAGVALDSVAGTHGLGQWKEFDVTQVVSGDGLVTFVVQIEGGNDVWFSSSEGTEPPQLIVEVAPVVYPPGDYNRDQTVDTSDHEFWKMNYGATAGIGLQADGNGNGTVDAADYTVWRDNLGASSLAAELAQVGSVVEVRVPMSAPPPVQASRVAEADAPTSVGEVKMQVSAAPPIQTIRATEAEGPTDIAEPSSNVREDSANHPPARKADFSISRRPSRRERLESDGVENRRIRSIDAAMAELSETYQLGHSWRTRASQIRK